MDNYAIDTAARFGDIPFTQFTRDLVTETFDALVEAHVDQMEAYSKFVSSLTQDLSTYINNTIDGVSFADISDFITDYELPKLDSATLNSALKELESPSTTTKPTIALPSTTTPAPAGSSWWGGLINALAPAATALVGKIKDGNLQATLNAVGGFNAAVASTIPTYKEIHDAVAALIASNKYGLLQAMAKQGVMRLLVTEFEIETKITFSTWNETSSGSETGFRKKLADKEKIVKGGGIIGIFKAKKKDKTRSVTVNTAKSYQRDSSGTRVDIFGRVRITGKSDYAPLNG